MVKKCGRKGSPEVIPSNRLLKSWLTSGVTLSRWGPRPVEFWKSPRMEILQPLWASSSLWFFFFLQYAVKISLLLHVVAFTACPFTMQTTRLWITCPYPMFLVKKEKKKTKKTERTALIFHQFRNCMTCRRAFIHRREESLLRVCTV